MEWKPPLDLIIKLNFDATFDESRLRFVSRVVVRNGLGEILNVLIVIHDRVATSFTTEAYACLQVILLEKK